MLSASSTRLPKIKNHFAQANTKNFIIKFGLLELSLISRQFHIVSTVDILLLFGPMRPPLDSTSFIRMQAVEKVAVSGSLRHSYGIATVVSVGVSIV